MLREWKKRGMGFLLVVLVLLVSAWPQGGPKGRPTVSESIKRGNEALSKGEYAEAIAAYTESIRTDPPSATTFYARGFAYYRSHKADQAIQDFSEAIKLESGYADAFRERGRVYEDKGDYQHAIGDYTKAIHLKAADVDLLYSRAFDYERSGQYDLAIADLTEVIRRYPQSGDAYRDRGLAQLLSAHIAEAQQDLAQAVENRPKEPFNVIWLYVARAKSGATQVDELAQNAAQLDLKKWPAPVIELFWGKSTPEAVLKAAADKDPRKNGEQQCEARYYIGQYDAFHHQRTAALRNFRLAAATCDKNYFLYLPAVRMELARKPSKSPK